MKRLFVLFAIVAMLFTANLKAEETEYVNWFWNGLVWVYVGTGDPGDPPPVPPAKI